MIRKIEAVVLKSIDYSETSQIVTLFARELGLVTVLARGARRPKSKFGSTLQPMSHIEAVVYDKEGRSILPLSEASHAKLRRNLSRDLEKITTGLRIVELVKGLSQERDANPELFALILQCLDRLDTLSERVSNLLLYFQMRFASLLGVAPNIVKPDVESIDHRGFLSLETGEVVQDQRLHARPASRRALRTFAILSRSDLDTVLRLSIDDQVQREVASLIDTYFRFHFENAYPTRSEPVLNKIAEVYGERT